MQKFLLILVFFTTATVTQAQRISVEEYIEKFKDIAMNEMKRSGVPASITLAQGILESESGNSELVQKSNNHFGIKCKSNWSGESVTHDDDENGECFRAYNDAAESYRDHSDFLKVNKRYSSLFALDQEDYEGWAKGLKKAGYATNPRYPDLLVKYIEQYNLQQYSLAVLDKAGAPDIAETVDKADDVIVGQVDKQDTQLRKTEEQPAISETVSNINRTKCVFVKKGTSLLLVAKQHKISLNKLMEFNDLAEEGILGRDQVIYLQKKQKTGESEFYSVLPGESIHDVSQKNGVQLKYLLSYNDLKAGDKLTPNAKLSLQPPPTAGRARTHRVAPKEGLFAIARVYNVTVKQLRKWNKLDSDDLEIGQEIIISK